MSLAFVLLCLLGAICLGAAIKILSDGPGTIRQYRREGMGIGYMLSHRGLTITDNEDTVYYTVGRKE